MPDTGIVVDSHIQSLKFEKNFKKILSIASSKLLFVYLKLTSFFCNPNEVEVS